MKKLILLGIIAFLTILPAAAQSTMNFDTMQQEFQSFADSVAEALPLNASIGHQWSDAYIGQLFSFPPHLGIGATFGFTTIPLSSVTNVFSGLGVAVPSELEDLTKYGGIPLPGYSIDARIGGIGIPSDIGVKFGVLHKDGILSLPFDLEYNHFGVDFRFALLKGNIILPKLSVGAGYNYVFGAMNFAAGLGTTEITSFTAPDGTTYDLSLTDPNLRFEWESSVIDLKAQISKKILFITPYAGVGASVGLSTAGGGLHSELLLNGDPITEEEIAQIEAAFEDAGQDPPDLSSLGLIVDSGVNGWTFRVFGGFSLNILIAKLDVGAVYDFIGGYWGGSIGARIQL
ncbi:MAG: hypothetical protein ACLFSE_01280 [Spirochaetia bacterium]